MAAPTPAHSIPPKQGLGQGQAGCSMHPISLQPLGKGWLRSQRALGMLLPPLPAPIPPAPNTALLKQPQHCQGPKIIQPQGAPKHQLRPDEPSNPKT